MREKETNHEALPYYYMDGWMDGLPVIRENKIFVDFLRKKQREREREREKKT